MTIILFSSLGRMFRLKRPSSGYGQVNGGVADTRRGSFIGRGGRGDIDAENRLIDQLDEEWED